MMQNEILEDATFEEILNHLKKHQTKTGVVVDVVWFLETTVLAMEEDTHNKTDTVNETHTGIQKASDFCTGQGIHIADLVAAFESLNLGQSWTKYFIQECFKLLQMLEQSKAK